MDKHAETGIAPPGRALIDSFHGLGPPAVDCLIGSLLVAFFCAVEHFGILIAFLGEHRSR
jgi:hypothetical protein